MPGFKSATGMWMSRRDQGNLTGLLSEAAGADRWSVPEAPAR